MIKDLKVAAVQAGVPQNHQEGEKQVVRLVKEAISKGVDMVGLPEYCLGPYANFPNSYDPFGFLSNVASKYSCYLFGASARKDMNNSISNTGFLFNSEGDLIGIQEKIFLSPEESDFVQGNVLKVFKTKLGNLSLLVCRDAFVRYSPWLLDLLRKNETEVVLIPSLSLSAGSKQYNIDLWVESLKTLSKWFYMCMVAPGTVGRNMTPHRSFGHSLIIDHRGKLFEGSGDKEDIIYAEISTSYLQKRRKLYESKWQPGKVPKVRLVKK